MKPGQKQLGQALPQQFVTHAKGAIFCPLEPSALRLERLACFNRHLCVHEVDPQITIGHPRSRRHGGDSLLKVLLHLGPRPQVPRAADGGPAKRLEHGRDVLVRDQLVRRPLEVRHLVGREVVDALDVVERRGGRDLAEQGVNLAFHLLETELRPLLVQYGPVAVDADVGDVA